MALERLYAHFASHHGPPCKEYSEPEQDSALTLAANSTEFTSPMQLRHQPSGSEVTRELERKRLRWRERRMSIADLWALLSTFEVCPIFMRYSI